MLATGNFVEAKKSFKQSIKLNPNDANSHRSLSRLTKYSSVLTDEHFKELIKIYKLSHQY